jgi:hypothetical protein
MITASYAGQHLCDGFLHQLDAFPQALLFNQDDPSSLFDTK